VTSVELDSLITKGAPICYGILMPGSDTPSGIPVVKVRDYDHAGIDVDKLLRAAPEIEAPYHRSRLEAGDLLMSIRGTTGVIAVVPPALKGANITQDTARIRVDPQERDYLYQALHAPVVQRQIRLHTIGQAVKGINIGSVRQLQIPWPAENARKVIARTLGDCDSLIRTLCSLIDRKRTFKRGLIQQLLTGRARFPDFARSSETQPAQFGTVPKDWSVVHISEVAREIKTRGAVEGAVVYSCTKHDGLVPSLEYFGRQVFSRNLDGYKRLQAGDFAYATNHIEEGSIGLLRNGQAPGLVSPMYTVFRPTERVNPEFLFALLKTESYRRVFEIRMSASIDRRGSLRWRDFSRIKVGLPTVHEQKRVVETLRLIDVEIRQLERLHDLIELQKRALLSKLLADTTVVPS
jgi:restriction endonuclease S subunit